MRTSLLLRLLAFSLAVIAVVATALLAAYDTGSRLRDELEHNASLLETDSEIRAVLLRYARQHRDWTAVEPLVRELAERTGRRIARNVREDRTGRSPAAVRRPRRRPLPRHT